MGNRPITLHGSSVSLFGVDYSFEATSQSLVLFLSSSDSDAVWPAAHRSALEGLSSQLASLKRELAEAQKELASLDAKMEEDEEEDFFELALQFARLKRTTRKKKKRIKAINEMKEVEVVCQESRTRKSVRIQAGVWSKVCIIFVVYYLCIIFVSLCLSLYLCILLCFFFFFADFPPLYCRFQSFLRNLCCIVVPLSYWMWRPRKGFRRAECSHSLSDKNDDFSQLIVFFDIILFFTNFAFFRVFSFLNCRSVTDALLSR